MIMKICSILNIFYQISYLNIKVWRRTGSTYYKLVGQTLVNVLKEGVYTVTTSHYIQVFDGDVIGFYYPGQSVIPFSTFSCINKQGLFDRSPSMLGVKTGALFQFHSMIKMSHPCRHYSLMARIIPSKLSSFFGKQCTNSALKYITMI